MPRSWLASRTLVLVLAASACTHDYDALKGGEAPDIRSGNGGSSASGGGGSGGRGGSDSGGDSGGGSGGSEADGGSGTGGDSGITGGSGGAGGVAPDACEPCADLSDEAIDGGLLSCCSGVRNRTCGLAVSARDDAVCLARDMPGEPDETCPAIGPVGNRRDGCCRPDGRCGAEYEALGLGCVAREDIPAALAPRADAIACRFMCVEDADCAGVPDVETVCAQGRSMSALPFCAVVCQRDQDCGGELVCALSPDRVQDRLITFCQEPYGDRGANEVCTNANQCDHGACLQLTGQLQASCSQFCEVNGDCPESLPFCVDSQIGRPSGMGDPIAFRVCSAEAF